ncbi:TolC family outer membrane protein [Wenzhouxiangella sp. AB-CW3]|uniref:TolC family outer membrane protein n=1 Tax=Wenzhouxiangella sp. AB-CW3 TaxID=2771012 RepID=UPI00168AC8AE|nr:TolC family outer membrane protein [Wenzhouxiangella sp. AB-CW3]QOC21844.1 TolC family outer membrane protein [Wenzhouxiangella sp. AB-CW3]
MKQRFICAAIAAVGMAHGAHAVDLMGVYELAQANDAELRAAEQRLSAAGEIPTQARAALLPTITGTASRTIGRSRTTIAGTRLDSEDDDTENYNIQLRQTIYDDANYGRLDRGRAELSAAEAVYAEAWQNFLFRVTERYFDVLTALDSVRFASAEETALRRQFEQAEQRFEVGLAAVTDVHEARAVYDAARARVITADNQLEDAREALREIAGTWFENYARLIDDVPLEGPDPEAVEDWVELALDFNPSVLQQRSQVDVADADLRIARAGHFPTLDLTGGYNRFINNDWVGRDPITQEALASAELRNRGWEVGLNLNVPIFQGFAVQSQRRQAGYSLRAADETLDQTRRSVIRQTETSYRAIVAGIREVEARRQALISADSALEATNAGFEVGTRTIVDVLQSEQRFFQAERDYSQARHQFILNQLRLRQVAGVLEENDLVEVNQLLR